MGAILFIIFSVLLYAVKILHNSRNLTFDKWCEIFISFFVFTNCLGFGLPLIDLDLGVPNGAFGFKFRLEVFMIITPMFFIVMARRLQWRFPPIPWYVVLAIVLFSAINLLNPNNLAVSSTAIALLQLVCYLIFLYLICSCVSIDVLLRGMYEGLMYTTILQCILAICYPILGMTSVVELFREGVSIRAESRPGAPGTFTHPNNLGGYMTYIVSFFFVCYLMGYKKRESLVWGLIAFFVLIFTFSRTALVAAIAALIVIVLIYTTKNSSIFSIKNLFTRILPLLFAAVAFIFFTPIKDSFVGSNMDDMMLARLMHFYCGYEIITEYPLLGVGLNAHLEYIRTHISFGAMFGDVNKIFWMAEEFMFSNPIHNIFLLFLSELGIIGTLPILYFIVKRFYGIKNILRSDSTDAYKIMSLYSIGLICCVCIHGMADWAPMHTLLRNIWMLVLFVTALNRYRYNNNNIAPAETTQ